MAKVRERDDSGKKSHRFLAISNPYLDTSESFFADQVLGVMVGCDPDLTTVSRIKHDNVGRAICHTVVV